MVGGNGISPGELDQQRDCLLWPQPAEQHRAAESFRWEGPSGGHWSNLPSKQDQIRLLRTVSTWVLKTSKDGDHTTFLGNLLLGFSFFLYIQSDPLFFSLRRLPLVRYHALLWRSQLHCLDNLPIGSDRWLIRSPRNHFFCRLNKPWSLSLSLQGKSSRPWPGWWQLAVFVARACCWLMLSLLSGQLSVRPAFHGLFCRAAPHSVNSQPIPLPGALSVQMEDLPFVLV